MNWKWYTLSATAIGGMWMRIPHITQVLLIVMGFDILSGLCAAFYQKKLNSSVMLRGLVTKAGMFILIGLVHVIEEPLNLTLFSGQAGLSLALIIYEVMSILENLANSGVPIPTVLVAALAKVKIPTATGDQIRKEFAGEETSTMTVEKSSEIIKTPDSSPDLRVELTKTMIEQKSVAPVKPVG